MNVAVSHGGVPAGVAPVKTVFKLTDEVIVANAGVGAANNAPAAAKTNPKMTCFFMGGSRRWSGHAPPASSLLQVVCQRRKVRVSAPFFLLRCAHKARCVNGSYSPAGKLS